MTLNCKWWSQLQIDTVNSWRTIAINVLRCSKSLWGKHKAVFGFLSCFYDSAEAEFTDRPLYTGKITSLHLHLYVLGCLPPQFTVCVYLTVKKKKIKKHSLLCLSAHSLLEIVVYFTSHELTNRALKFWCRINTFCVPVDAFFIIFVSIMSINQEIVERQCSSQFSQMYRPNCYDSFR